MKMFRLAIKDNPSAQAFWGNVKSADDSVRKAWGGYTSLGAISDNKEQARKLKELLDSLVELGAIFIEKGATDFAAWEKEMLNQVSDKLKPVLPKVFVNAQRVAAESKRDAVSQSNNPGEIFCKDNSTETIQLRSRTNDKLNKESTGLPQENRYLNDFHRQSSMDLLKEAESTSQSPLSLEEMVEQTKRLDPRQRNRTPVGIHQEPNREEGKENNVLANIYSKIVYLKAQLMMKKKLTYLGITLFGILLILTLLNPSMKQFEEFVPSQIPTSKIDKEYLSVSRGSNWIIFSTYLFSYEDDEVEESGKYYGFLNNFFKIW